jgi:predicted TIM-barrel fold metal-dependent hydrolase
VPVVIDHFGMPRAERGLEQSGFSLLCDLLRSGNCWVKISAPYRISSQPDYGDVRPFIEALADAGPRRVIWASDWPHTGEHKGQVGAEAPMVPFRYLDDRGLTDLVTSTLSESAARLVFIDNPKVLYDRPFGV